MCGGSSSDAGGDGDRCIQTRREEEDGLQSGHQNGQVSSVRREGREGGRVGRREGGRERCTIRSGRVVWPLSLSPVTWE